MKAKGGRTTRLITARRNLDAHLEVGDVRDAARDHFVHESKIRPDHPLFDHSSTLGWDVHFLTARRNFPRFS